jgi:hypothetical protein
MHCRRAATTSPVPPRRPGTWPARVAIVAIVTLAVWLANWPAWRMPGGAALAERPAATRGGATLRSLEQSLAPLARRYELTITLTDPPKPAHTSIKYTALTDAEVSSAEPYVKLFAEEWAKYPAPFIKASRLKAVAFVTDLSVNGQHRAAVPDAPAPVLFLDPKVGDYNRAYQRHCIHHDFYHLVEREINGDINFKDPKWAALNDPPFHYGRGGEFATTSDQFEINHPAPGFINKYSQSGIEEDKAEIFAATFTPEYRRSMEQWAQRDGVLRAKVEMTRAFAGAYQAPPRSEKEKAAREFFLAVRRNDVAAAVLLLGPNPDLVAVKDARTWTALHWAAAHGRPDEIRMLLAHKSDVNAKDKDGWTPLHVAAAAGHNAACDVLIEAGADPTAKDARARTPADWAQRMDHYALVARLKK